MAHTTDSLHWQETMNSVTIDCSLDIALHPAQSDTVLLTIPGVDGSVNGYEDKYIRIVEGIQQRHGIAAVRIANPFITSHHWESNPRRILDYIATNAEAITGSAGQPRIKVVAHSAGASIIARIAHEYPEIQEILLINPAQKLDSEAIRDGLRKTSARVTVVFGSKDPSKLFGDLLKEDGHTVVIVDGADHFFSGEHLKTFIGLPGKYVLR